MKEIVCTRGFVALVDDEDYPRLAGFRWAAIYSANRRRPEARPRRSTGKRSYVWMCHEILPPKVGFVVDHINGNTLDNRRSNLRYATLSQNACNSRGRCSDHPYKGVQKKGRRWYATVTVNGRRMSVPGGFDTLEDAALARDEAALKFHGEFARLNFPRETA